MSEREEIIIEHLKLAMTGYLGPRGTAQTVAHAFDLLSALRREWISWDRISVLMNTARDRYHQQHNLPAGDVQTSARTVCRLYHLQKDRLALATAKAGERSHSVITLETLLGLSITGVPNASATRNSAHVEAPPQENRANQARDGPQRHPPADDLFGGLQKDQDRKNKISNISKESFDDEG